MFTGIENVIGGVIDVMKESTSIGSFKEDIEKLATDVANGLAIPPEQKDQVTSEIRQDIKETGTSSVNSEYFVLFSNKSFSSNYSTKDYKINVNWCPTPL